MDHITTLDAYEAKHAIIHAQALTMVNSMVLIFVVLDRTTINYNKRHTLFIAIPRKYALVDHVLSDMDNLDHFICVHMDCTILI